MNDDDRWPWLRVIRDHLSMEAEKVKNLDMESKHRAVIVTCSSLKKVYRDVLREVPSDLGKIIFVYLKGTKELLLQRIQGRQGHFMPASMLQSQLDTLEEPKEDEETVIIASIIPTPDEEAKIVIEEAVERGFLPSSAHVAK